MMSAPKSFILDELSDMQQLQLLEDANEPSKLLASLLQSNAWHPFLHMSDPTNWLFLALLSAKLFVKTKEALKF